MHERPSSRSVQRIASLGDQARRTSLAVSLVPRFGPAVAGLACLTAALTAVLGGPRIIGPAVLGVSTAIAALGLLAARRERPVKDDVAEELDRAAGLRGALRSAHWFVGKGVPPAHGVPDVAWIDYHLRTAAERADGVDWPRVYRRPSARGSWLATLALVVATIALAFWPRPMSAGRGPSPRATDNRPAVESQQPQALPSALLPQLVDGMRAMQAGKAPSREALSAIGKALELGKSDRAAQKEIDSLLARIHDEGLTGQPGDAGSGESWGDENRDPRDVYSSALQWGYQEAMAKASGDDPPPAPGTPALTPPAGDAGKSREGEHETGAAAGDTLDGAPVKGDTKGQAAGFASLLFGRQQASDDGGGTAAGKPAQRTATLAAVLRNEVVHAREDVSGANVDATNTRRATNLAAAASATVAASRRPYDRVPATQPPAVPQTRRQLVHDYFRRQADAEPPVKRP